MPGNGVTRRRSHLANAQRERHGMPCPISMDADLMTPDGCEPGDNHATGDLVRAAGAAN